MPKTVARYSMTLGLAGCYMPDSAYRVQEYATRAELADAIRAEIAAMEWPANCFAQVGIRFLWRKIQRIGSSSSCHFSIDREGYQIAFHGATLEEFEQAENGLTGF